MTINLHQRAFKIVFSFVETTDSKGETETKEDEKDCPPCPLCHESFNEYSTLETHVMQLHSVNSEGLKRLLMLMEGSHWLNNTKSTPTPQQFGTDDADGLAKGRNDEKLNLQVALSFFLSLQCCCTLSLYPDFFLVGNNDQENMQQDTDSEEPKNSSSPGANDQSPREAKRSSPASVSSPNDQRPAMFMTGRKMDKGINYPLEKYLDPNRPYKCDVCKESFTQKNILLVHYNSVSHLHKLKKTMQDQQKKSSPQKLSSLENALNNLPNAKQIRDDDEAKPYKCNICKVAYNQGSTLDIHIRSVLHQNRAAKLQELAMSGQVDLSKPLIEQPENKGMEDHQKKTLAGHAQS